jgi:single-stranded DNA-binding protein
MRTTVTFEGQLAANPDLTITQNGKNIVEFTHRGSETSAARSTAG